MNVFGGARSQASKGPRGPRGFPGKEGSINDFCAYLPNTILKQMREHEETCFLLDSKDPETDLVRKGQEIEQWKNRNVNKRNLTAEMASSKLIKTKDWSYAIDFQNNRYHLDAFFIECLPGYGYLCITFCVQGEGEQVLITNHKPRDVLKNFHEISVTGHEINIWGYRNNKPACETIQHNCRNWTTLFLDYTVSTNVELTYILDNDPHLQGHFAFQDPRACQAGVYIGGRHDNTRFLTGAIHAIELYYTRQVQKPIPQSMKELVIKSQQIRSM